MSTDTRQALAALPPLPKKRRAMLCTKCGFSGPTEAEASPQGAKCQRCDYTAFVEEQDYNDDEMQAYARAALAAQPVAGAVAEPCNLCNALTVPRNATHYDAEDLAAASVRAKLMHKLIPVEAPAPEPSAQELTGPVLCWDCTSEQRAFGIVTRPAYICPKHRASAPSTPPPAVVEAGALTDERIDSLRGLDTAGRVRFYEHDFYVLSNFSAFTLVWKGIRFDTSEAAYHWEKFDGCDQEVQDMILEAPSAHAAFKIAESQRIVRRADWDEIKVDVMHRILRSKAEQHEYVRRKLLATGDRELVEDSWRDDFWGWGPNRDGKNMLGRLWMQVRSELRGIAPKAAQEKT